MNQSCSRYRKESRAARHEILRAAQGADGHPEVLQRPDNIEGVLTFDLGQHGRE